MLDDLTNLNRTQLYGMKWARLMFGREFRVESVLRLWDHMFASTAKEGRPNLPERIELVAVGMVSGG